MRVLRRGPGEVVSQHGCEGDDQGGVRRLGGRSDQTGSRRLAFWAYGLLGHSLLVHSMLVVILEMALPDTLHASNVKLGLPRGEGG